jgi:hypothetical protein
MRLICGVGVNDADYTVKKHAFINGKTVRIWTCPFYVRWVGIIDRCYGKKASQKWPTYLNCSTVDEWHLFSNFRSWMEIQDWEGKDIDKDILFPNNKIYGPDTCVFVNSNVNTFIVESNGSRGQFPIGVSFDDNTSKKYLARCWSIETGKQKNLGRYFTAEEAHLAWLQFKLRQARILAAQQTDERVAKALVARYENYKC